MLFCSGMGILLSDDIKLNSLQIKMNSFKNGFQESLSSALYIIRQLAGVVVFGKMLKYTLKPVYE
jgi:hypothetical protein